MKIIKQYKFSLLTFILTFIIMTLVFAKMKMYPFGENQILIIDSWHQYFPIFSEYHQKLQNFSSLLYSWNSGGGTNFITMMGYYAMSPLNLLSIVTPEAYIREFFMFATIIKIALGGMFFSIYLMKLHKKEDIGITIFGLLYAFSGFMLGYYWNIMWLDIVALLPLIILGLHKLIDEDKYTLYVISLAAALISNFYISFFVCLFIAFYYFVLFFSKKSYKVSELLWFKELWLKTIKVAFYSILAIGIAAVTLLPIMFGMSLAYGHSSADPTKFETYYSLFEIFNNLFINRTPTIVDGLPNIYSGMLALALLPLYFLHKTIPTRAKVLHGGMLVFMFFSLNINILNFIWHGLHFPNQVPFRFSFIVTFLILSMTYSVFTQLESITVKQLVWTLGGYFLYIFASDYVKHDPQNFKVLYMTFFIIAVLIGLILLYKKNIITVERLMIIIYVCVIFEAYYNGYNTAKAAGFSGREDYIIQNTEVQKSLNYLKTSDPSFYRVEMFGRYSVNDPLMYGYKGLSQFASTANSKFSAFTQLIGMPSDAGANTITYTPNTPALNGMFNIKYMLSKYKSLADPNIAYELVHEEKDLTVYENKYFLPLGYRVNEEILDLDLYKINPFERQESFYQLATGKTDKVFYSIPILAEEYTNIEITEYEGIRFHYKNLDPSTVGKAKITYKALETKQMYVYMLNQTKTMTITMRSGGSSVHETPRGIIIDMGIVQKDTEFDLEFELPAAPSGYYDIGVTTFDEKAFEQLIAPLQEESLTITSFSDTSIEGTIDAKSSGLIYTSIPYEEGWHVNVNGRRVKPLAFKDAMIAIPVTEGTQVIELSYVPKGIVIGSIISILSLLILILHKRLLNIISK